jgi:type I restriction-modification system DNA methylase subunit
MNPELARKTIVETFRQKFDDARFLYFIRNLVNHLDESKKQTWTLKKAAFEDFVNHFTRLGTYTDADGEAVDVLVIHLRKDTTLARGRVTLRNFVADYLATGHGQGKAAVMAAFVSPTEDDWRFSFVKLDYTFEKTELGFVAERIQLTPARRYSYLVGKNENCHTAQKQFLALLETHEINPTVAQLEAAFSVEKVTREFYDHYKDLFEQTRDALAAFLDTAPKIKTHFAERGIECDDFAKKLLGQIVFLYFLQKKGWFGVERGKTWGSGRKDFIRHLFNNRADYAHIPGQRKRPANFFNDILEPLFYEAIAAPRTDEDHYYSRFDCKIPFLNGGLFEPLYGYNWVETEILLPDTLFANDQPSQEKGETGTGILDVFDRYNFTVNEAEPLEKEVAVDPEMLGLVFENLLPENVRHSSGTFYTPRVIVHYMCQQALLHYLTVRATDIPQADLALFLRLAERFTDFQAKETKKHADKRLPESIRNNAARLDELLATITVCDPAIGSGAFPVGMMLEICRARMALAAVEGMPEQTFYHLKRHAIQHSLYGVDLDPGAVEIAKLRLWLSMVVDEDNITDIQPLPNLDYKIMQGNSLLEEFDGVRLLDEKLLQPPAASRESEIADLKNRISVASQEFVRLHGEGKKSAAAKLATEQEIKRLKKQLAGLVHPDEAKPDGQGELNQQTSWASLKRIQELHSNFFDEDSRAEKDKLRRELDGLEWNFMEATLRESGRAAALAELKRASATHRKPFFLWRLHFGEVFQKRGGFDVVIANPPYVRQEEIKEFKPAFKRSFECFTGTADLFVFFYERSVKLLRDGGALALITSNKYYRAGYGEKLRGFLVRELTLQQLIDFGDAPVFEAIAYASILTGVRTAPTPDASVLGYTWENEMPFDRIAQIVPERGQQIRQDELKPDSWRLESPAVFKLLEKLRKRGKPLGEYVQGRFYNGVKSGHTEAFVVDDATRERLIEKDKSSKKLFKPYLAGRDLKRWRVQPRGLWLIYLPWHFPLHEDSTITTASANAEKEFRKLHPAIYEHLEQFKDELARRDKAETGVRYEWYAMARPRFEFHNAFDQPKIILGRFMNKPTYAFDKEGFYHNDAQYSIGGANPYLVAILNSNVCWWFLTHLCTDLQNGYLQALIEYQVQIPIPVVSPEKQEPVERLVDHILAAKAQDASADVSDSEHELNTLLYELYGLTPEEIDLVEDAQLAKKQPVVAEPTLPKGKRVTLGGVKYAIQLVQALLTESADGLTWPRLVDAFTLATQPSLMAQEAASADAAKILAWSKRWNEILPPGALITAIEQLGADNLAVTKSGNTWHISLKTARPKTSAEDVNYDAWLALRTLGPAPEIQLAAPVFATPNFAVWTQTIEALAA